jgi:hypothetical protein
MPGPTIQHTTITRYITLWPYAHIAQPLKTDFATTAVKFGEARKTFGLFKAFFIIC